MIAGYQKKRSPCPQSGCPLNPGKGRTANTETPVDSLNLQLGRTITRGQVLPVFQDSKIPRFGSLYILMYVSVSERQLFVCLS
ncbi:hypothetical protein PAMP_015426 [Pampus punctatissimus]